MQFWLDKDPNNSNRSKRKLRKSRDKLQQMRRIKSQSPKMRLKGHQSMKLSIDHNLHKRVNQENKNLSSNNVSRKKGCHKRRSTLKIAQQNIIQRFNRKQ